MKDCRILVLRRSPVSQTAKYQIWTRKQITEELEQIKNQGTSGTKQTRGKLRKRKLNSNRTNYRSSSKEPGQNTAGW